MVDLEEGFNFEKTFNEVINPTIKECLHEGMPYLLRCTNGKIVIRFPREGMHSIPIEIKYEDVEQGILEKIRELDKKDEDYYLDNEKIIFTVKYQIKEELKKLIQSEKRKYRIK